MTPFDIAAVLVLLVSGIIAFIRGATREVTTMIAFLLAVFVALFGLRYTGPIARHAIATAWIANSAAVLISFVVAYILFRVIGGVITRQVRQTAVLSSLDRILGLGIGLVRGAVIVGAVTLLINASTPPERMPTWITKAKSYPAATLAANGLRAFAPEGMRMARGVSPAVQDAVSKGLDDHAAPAAIAPAKPAHPAHPAKPDLSETSR